MVLLPDFGEFFRFSEAVGALEICLDMNQAAFPRIFLYKRLNFFRILKYIRETFYQLKSF